MNVKPANKIAFRAGAFIVTFVLAALVILTPGMIKASAAAKLEGFEGYADTEDLQIRNTDFWYVADGSGGSVELAKDKVKSGSKSLKINVDATKPGKGWSTTVGQYPWNGGDPKFEIEGQKGISFWMYADNPYTLRFAVMGPDLICGGFYIALKTGGWHQYYMPLENVKSYYPDKFSMFESKTCQGIQFIFLGDNPNNKVKTAVYVDDIEYVDTQPAGSNKIYLTDPPPDIPAPSASVATSSKTTGVSTAPKASEAASEAGEETSVPEETESVNDEQPPENTEGDPASEDGADTSSAAGGTEQGGGNIWLIIGIIIGAVVLLGGAAAFVIIKKRGTAPKDTAGSDGDE